MSRRRRNQAGISLFAFQDIITCVMGIMLLLTMMLCLQITIGGVSELQPTAVAAEVSQCADSLAEQLQKLQEDIARQQSVIDSGILISPELLAQQAQQLGADVRELQTDVEASASDLCDAERQQQFVENLARKRCDQPTQTDQLLQQNQKLERTLKSLQSGNRIVYNARDSEGNPCWVIEMRSSSEFWAAEIGRSKPPQRFGTAAALEQWITSKSGVSYFLIAKPSSADQFAELSEHLLARNISYGFDLLPDSRSALDPDTGAGVQ